MNYRKIPFALGAYGPMYPNSSFLSGPAPMTKVTFRADTSKPAGIPGFIAWLAETHPEVYNYSFAVMPHNVRIAMNKLKTGASVLTGTNAQAAYGAQRTRSTSGIPLSGLGDDTTAPLMDLSFDTGSVDTPQTVAIADTGESSGVPGLTSTGTSQLISSLAQAGQALVTGIDQQRIFNVQLQRAQNGQPPLNTGAYFTAAGSTLSGYLPWIAGAGLVGLVFMSRKKG
jgi:hypothetical protein